MVPKLTQEEYNLLKANALNEEADAVLPSTDGVTDEEVSRVLEKTAERDAEREKYGSSGLEAAALGAARGLTLGLSDVAAKEAGLYTPEELKKISEYNPGTSLLGEIGGTVAPAFISGGSSLAAKGAATAAGEVLAKEALEEGAKQIGRKSAAEIVGKALQYTPAGLASRAGTAVEGAVASSLGKKLGQGAFSMISKEAAAKAAGFGVEGAAQGLGRLLTEDAFGDAELNAETALQYAAEGAAIGGALGGVFGGASGALGKLSEASLPTLKKAGGLFVDVERDTQKFLGHNINKVRNNLALDPDYYKKMPEWLVKEADLGNVKTANELLGNLQNIADRSASNIDEIASAVDNTAASLGKNIDPSVYKTIAKDIEERLLNEASQTEASSEFFRKVKQIRNDLVKRADEVTVVQKAKVRLNADGSKTILEPAVVKAKPLTAEELLAKRREMDQLARFGKVPDAALRKGEEAARLVRYKINQEIERFANDIDPKLSGAFKKANKDYRYAVDSIGSLEKKAIREDSLFGREDFFAGLLASGVTNVGVGAAVLAGKAFLNTDLKRRLVLLDFVNGSSKKFFKRTQDAVKGFYEKASKPTRLLSTKILVKSLLSNDEGKEAKDEKQAFKNIQKNLNQYAAQPEKITDRVAKASQIMAGDLPKTSQAVAQTLIRGIQFLQQKMPKTMAGGGVYKREYTPSSLELAKFARYVQAVENPLSTLDDLKQGTLTREHVEALRSVYPKMYDEVRQEALKYAMDESNNLTYNKKLQLGILLDIPADQSLNADFLLSMQQQFQGETPQQPESGQAQTAVPTTQTGLSKVSFAGRAETDTQAVANRGTEA